MMINTLLTGWHFMRWLRLGLGIYIGVQAFQTHDALAGFISAFFLFQAFSNTGCGANGCSTSVDMKSKEPIENVSFEEIK